MQRDNDKYMNEMFHGLLTSEPATTVRASELEAIFAAISEYVTVYDHKGQVVRIHQAGAERVADSKLSPRFPHSLHTLHSKMVVRDEDGNVLTEEQLPVQRILRGEVLHGKNAPDLMLCEEQGSEQQIHVCGAPIYDRDGMIAGAVTITLDVTERRMLEQRTQKSLNALLVMAEALVQEDLQESASTADDSVHATADEEMIERRMLELPCRLLDCQRVGIALLEPDRNHLQPMVVVGASPEHELQWRNNLQGISLQNLLGDPQLVTRLQEGQLLSLDANSPFFHDNSAYKLITPIMRGSQLIGILLLGYGSTKPSYTAYEMATIQGVARLASLVIQREQAHVERDQALSQLQTANKELERANKIKSNFVSMISHEFRTALTGIQGFSEIIRDSNLGLAEVKEFAVDIYNDARRLVRLITDMVDLEKAEAGRIELNLGWLDLNALILDVVAHIQAQVPEHTFRVRLANALPIMLGDYEKLTQVVTNVIENTISFSAAESEIVISSVVEGNAVHISVSNSGEGIAASELERMFERYAEGGTARSRGVEGTVIGLPQVRDIVQLHGGQVWAESIPNKGSIFHFTVQFTGAR